MSSKAAKKSNQKNAYSGGNRPAETGSSGRWMLIPVALILGYLPLVMRTYQYDPGLSQFEWFDDGQVVDVYLASKMIVIIIIGFLMIAMFALYKLIEGEKAKFEKILVPLGIYFAGVVLSGITSPYKALAWGGSFEMFESVPVVMVYVFSAYYLFKHMKDLEDFRFYWHIAAPGILIESVIATMQGFGKDFLATSFGKHLYLAPAYWSQIDTMTTGMGDVAYGTLYNPDFLPIYYAAAIPIAAAAFFSVAPPADAVTLALKGKSELFEKRRYTYERIFNAIVLGFTILALYESRRSTGFFVLLAMGLIMLVGDFITEKKQIVLFALVGVILLAGFVAVGLTDTPIGNTIRSLTDYGGVHKDSLFIKNLYNKEDEVTFVVTYKGKDYTYQSTVNIEETTQIDPNTGEAVIDPNTGEPVVNRYPVVTLTADDTGGAVIAASDDTKVTWTATMADDPDFSIRATGYITPPVVDELTGEQTADEYYGVQIYVKGYQWKFVRTEEGYKFRNFRDMNIDFPSDVEYYRTFSEEFFHGRGHIYNYTLPKLKEHILLGAGSNTYIMVYPQNDYLTETSHSLDVKAHCFYLQQWLENGLIATVALIVFLLWLLFALINILTTPIDDPQWKRGGFWRGLTLASIALIAGVMVSWLTNDSNICASPVVWSGFGIALVCYKKGKEMTGKEGN